MSTTTVPRAATAALVGGALWALLPVAWATATTDGLTPGSPTHLAVAASHSIFLVLPPALILLGLAGLRRVLGGAAGRVGVAGTWVAGAGLAAMALGNGIEVASITAGGGEVALGHAMFLIGFLVSVVGHVLLGIVVVRRRRDGLSRSAGFLLALALPLGLGIGAVGSAVGSQSDAWFWAAISVPTGIAWVLLGWALRTATDRPAREPAPAL